MFDHIVHYILQMAESFPPVGSEQGVLLLGLVDSLVRVLELITQGHGGEPLLGPIQTRLVAVVVFVRVALQDPVKVRVIALVVSLRQHSLYQSLVVF